MKKSYMIAKKLCNIFVKIWLILTSLIIFISIIGIFLGEPNLYDGWKKFNEIFNPFNVANYIVTAILLSPAIIAMKLEEYFEKKSKI